MVSRAANSDGLKLTPRSVLKPFRDIAGRGDLAVVLAAVNDNSLGMAMQPGSDAFFLNESIGQDGKPDPLFRPML